MSGQNPSQPRRGRKRADRSDVPLSFLPHNNPRARTAYVSALLGLIPVLGLPCGLAALVFGWFGWRAARAESDGNGLGHSLVSMVLGGLEFTVNAIGLPLIATSQGWI